MVQVVYLYGENSSVYRLCPEAEWAYEQGSDFKRFDNDGFRFWANTYLCGISDPARNALLWLGGLCQPSRPLATVEPGSVPTEAETLALCLRELEEAGLILRLGPELSALTERMKTIRGRTNGEKRTRTRAGTG